MREDITPSQTIKSVLGLRGMILDGELKPGARVIEQMLVDKFGVSRTPARAALARVCEEGLLENVRGGGYTVAKFSDSDVFDAIAIRGTLEGMAARLAAERGVSLPLLTALKKCVDDLDQVVARLEIDPDLTEYVRLNDKLHDLLMQACQSTMLKRSLERLVTLPFAAPNAFVSLVAGDRHEVRKILRTSQDQHRWIVEAIEAREGTRAEALAHEHSRSAWKYLQLIFNAEATPDLPALRLVDRPTY